VPPISAIPRLDGGSFARDPSGPRWKNLRAPCEQDDVSLVCRSALFRRTTCWNAAMDFRRLNFESAEEIDALSA